ncbi:MAG TPA: UvrD-helicase domain-containing protein [Kofleriaceae bacterium]|jgi:exodeoxyribonuclease V beta subunit|nr:UvrD-helicase domain-containing protein [Kofleriaceae bacterium]
MTDAPNSETAGPEPVATGPEILAARPAALPPAGAKLVVVEASAGTGKTFFLEHRVVDLILAGAELGQILLVTFTDKAVAELRLRIRDVLDRLSRAAGSTATDPEAAWRLDDDARRRLRAAVTAFDHAPIYTIHGYCHRLLIEDAFSARRLFDQTQVADEVAFDAAFDVLLRERFAYRAPDRELLAAFLQTRTASGAPRTVDSLRALLLGCVRADAPLRRPIDPAAAQAALAALRAVFERDASRAAVIASDKRWAPAWVERITAALARCPADAPPALQLAAIDQLREPAEKIASRAAKLPPDVVAAVRGIATTMSLDEAIAAQMLPPIIARISEDKAEHGQFDYDDMLELVWAALTGPRRHELAARLRERTPWAMIDEFQDTDPVQWSIFRTVWMHPDARGLTIVGDPKQAIYGFRGADVDTYVAARDEMLRADATRVVLDVNRRSTEPLVAAVNQILIGTLGLPMLSGRITYDDPVRASGDVVCDDGRPPIKVFQLQAQGGKPTADANRSALAGAIGEAIEALRAAPPPWSARGVAQPFTLDQVMVLTRANRESAEIAAALRTRGLPCALVEPERLFKTREASELAAVLAAIAAPRNRSARLRALRTRFFDVPWPELMRVVDAPDHHPLIARIFDWAQLAQRRAYEPLFRRLVEDSRFAERALVLGGGERALTNTWHLIELLLAAVARSRCDLHELVGQLRRWIADDTTSHPDERDVQRSETDADAIRVLTIHKAKGLEAPYVFVFGGTSGGPKSLVHTLRDATGRALIVGKADAETQGLLDAEADAEHQRLAYVGLTRAQVRLYLPSYSGELTGGAMYQPIQRCLAPWIGPRPPAARALFEVIAVPVGAPARPPAPADALAGFIAPPPPAIAPLAPLAPSRGGLAMLSYTRLAHDPNVAAIAVHPGDALAIDPAEFDVDDTAGEVGPEDLPPGPDSGLFLHDVLEVAELELVRDARDAADWRADPAVAAQLADKARGRGVSPIYLPHAAAILYRTLTAPLALVDGHTLPPLADAAALAREVEFGYPLPTLPGPGALGPRGLVKGFIDALVAWDDELWVLDYKSDLLAGDDLAAAAQRRVRERYGVQARLYAIAADRMRGRRRLAGLLFAFVRHGITVPVRLADDTLAGWIAWLAQIAESPDTMNPAPEPRA